MTEQPVIDVSTSMPSLADSSQGGGQKARQRVSVACLSCRKKRTRCDGELPSCSPCKQQGVACEYQFSENKRKPPSKAYVRSLEARIQFLEQALAAKNTETVTMAQTSIDQHEEQTNAMHFTSQHEEEQQDLLPDVAGRLGRLGLGDDGQLHFFGSQSNYHLLQNNQGDTLMEKTINMQREGLAAAERLGKVVPLSRELQDHLLELFWTWHNPWNYIVHKRAFLAGFESRTYGKYCSPLLLSSIFALVSRYSNRSEVRKIFDDPSTAGSCLFEQAKIMLPYESQAPTAATVQAAALMALRAISDNEEALGWLYCGNAARMAFNLGLNLDCSPWINSSLISNEEVEVRKVVFWGCYALDKQFSIALGRPGCIGESFYTCPKLSLDDDAEFEPWKPGSPPDTRKSEAIVHCRTLSTGYYSAKCLTIASEAMQTIYAPNSQLSKDSIQGIIAKTDVDLRAYYVNMPSHLRLPPSCQSSAPAHVYQLHMQYHVHLILLHRPLLMKNGNCVLASQTTSVFLDDSHMVYCRDSASEVVRLLRIYKQQYTMRCAAIVTVHITFTAAVIFLIDAKHEDLQHRQQALRKLETCMSALEDMKRTWCAWSSKALQRIQNLAVQWSISLPTAPESNLQVPIGNE